ncbi:MAG: DinB family protein [Planctomycetaceae bacterium]
MKSVITAFHFTRRYCELLLADIDDAQMTNLPHPGMNHPAWIVGHVALAADLGAQLLGEDMATDEAWMAMFGPGSTPVDDRSKYPSKADLLAMVTRTYDRLLDLLEAADPETTLLQPNQTPFFPDQFPTTGDLLTHLMTTHAMLHLGQLSAWRRCAGLNSVLGI